MGKPRNNPAVRYGTVPVGTGMVLGQAESELQANVVDLARTLRLLTYHVKRSDLAMCEPGFPDWVFAGPGGVVYAELKTSVGKVSAAQQRWIDVLGSSTQRVHVWRPADWVDGTIMRELREIARPARVRS